MTARSLCLAALACGLLSSTAAIAGRLPTPAAFAYAADTGVLTVSGPIGTHFSDQLRAAMDRHPQAKLLVIDSPGGLRHHAFRSADLVNARQVPVRIDGRCASACALLWAMADTREITPRSRVGLHGSRFESPVPLPALFGRTVSTVNDRVTARVLRRAGFPEDVVRLGDRTPPSAMSWFRVEDLQAGRLSFRLADSPTHAPAPGAPARHDRAPTSAAPALLASLSDDGDSGWSGGRLHFPHP